MRNLTISVVTLTVGLVLGTLTHNTNLTAQGTESSPKALQGEVGTWTLNVAKSTYDPGPPTRSNTSTRQLDPRGVRVTQKGVDAQGQAFDTVAVWIYDGKDYPVTVNNPVTGTNAYDAIVRTRVDDFTVESKLKRNGRVIQTNTLVFSRDGQTATLTSKGTNGRGEGVNNVQVWEKQ